MSLNLEQKQAVVAEVSAQVAQGPDHGTRRVPQPAGGGHDRVAQESARLGCVPARSEKHPGAPRGRRYAVQGTVRSDGRTSGLRHFERSRLLPPRCCTSSAKENEKFVIKAGAMPNVVMSAKEVADLAKMPSRQELLATLLGTMQAPVANLSAPSTRCRAGSCGRWLPCGIRRKSRPREVAAPAQRSPLYDNPLFLLNF